MVSSGIRCSEPQNNNSPVSVWNISLGMIAFNKNSKNDINLYGELIKKNISIDLLKQVIEARINEIIKLAVIENNIRADKPSVIFIGSGSKLLSNSFNLDFNKDFSELIFFEENDKTICQSGINYHRSDARLLIKNHKRSKKTGIFEKFFNLFSQ